MTPKGVDSALLPFQARCSRLWLWAACVLAVTLPSSCAAREPGPPSFSCEALQERAERCEEAILQLVKRRYEVEKVTAGATVEDAHHVYLRFRERFQRKLRHRVLEGECQEVSRPQTRDQRRRWSALRYCFGRPGCESFGQCLLTQ